MSAGSRSAGTIRVTISVTGRGTSAEARCMTEDESPQVIAEPSMCAQHRLALVT